MTVKSIQIYGKSSKKNLLIVFFFYSQIKCWLSGLVFTTCLFSSVASRMVVSVTSKSMCTKYWLTA